MPFRPKRSNTQNLDVVPDLGDEKRLLNGAPESAPDAESSSVVANLEAKVNGSEAKQT